jgi:hypothetical protein
MNDDVLFYISTFLNDSHCAILLTLEKKFVELFRLELDRRRHEMHSKWFPYVLREYIPRLPRVHVADRTALYTHYIDFIKPLEMESKVMWGRDYFRRAFISIRHDRGVLTFFQRYTDRSTYWTTGGVYPDGLDMCGGFDMTIPRYWEHDVRLAYLRDHLIAPQLVTEKQSKFVLRDNVK